MAFSTKISFVPRRDSGKKSVSFDNVDYGIPIPLYDQAKLDADYLFLKFSKISSDGYLDYVAELTLEEFLKFHETNYKPKTYSNTDTKLRQFISNSILNSKYRCVQIVIYEWESGLN